LDLDLSSDRVHATQVVDGSTLQMHNCHMDHTLAAGLAQSGLVLCATSSSRVQLYGCHLASSAPAAVTVHVEGGAEVHCVGGSVDGGARGVLVAEGAVATVDGVVVEPTADSSADSDIDAGSSEGHCDGSDYDRYCCSLHSVQQMSGAGTRGACSHCAAGASIHAFHSPICAPHQRPARMPGTQQVYAATAECGYWYLTN
jgi:hypothetical protein